jgi:hypothetical protein
MTIILLLFEGASWSPDLSQVTMHLLMHCLEKPHKLVDPQVSMSFLFLKNAIAEYFVSSKLLYLVKEMYYKNL